MTQHRTPPQIHSTATVNEILMQHPAAVSVLNTFGIDACCGGAASLEEAACRDGVDLHALVEALEMVVTQTGEAR